MSGHSVCFGSQLVNPLATSLAAVAMVEIQQKVAMSYAGSPLVTIPDSLLVQAENGTQFLKIRGSHPTIVKLIAGSQQDKLKPNASLAASQKLAQLKMEVKKACEAEAGKASAQEQAGPGEEFFEESAQPKAKKIKLDKLPQNVVVKLEDKEIMVMPPSSWKSSDVMVKLDQKMLQVVFDMLAADLDECLQDSKRSYQKKAKGPAGPAQAAAAPKVAAD